MNVLGDWIHGHTKATECEAVIESEVCANYAARPIVKTVRRQVRLRNGQRMDALIEWVSGDVWIVEFKAKTACRPAFMQALEYAQLYSREADMWAKPVVAAPSLCPKLRQFEFKLLTFLSLERYAA